MYDRALLDRTLLAIAAASTAPVQATAPSPWSVLRTWWRGRCAEDSVPASPAGSSPG